MTVSEFIHSVGRLPWWWLILLWLLIPRGLSESSAKRAIKQALSEARRERSL